MASKLFHPRGGGVGGRPVSVVCGEQLTLGLSRAEICLSLLLLWSCPFLLFLKRQWPVVQSVWLFLCIFLLTFSANSGFIWSRFMSFLFSFAGRRNFCLVWTTLRDSLLIRYCVRSRPACPAFREALDSALLPLKVSPVSYRGAVQELFHSQTLRLEGFCLRGALPCT